MIFLFENLLTDFGKPQCSFVVWLRFLFCFLLICLGCGCFFYSQSHSELTLMLFIYHCICLLSTKNNICDRKSMISFDFKRHRFALLIHNSMLLLPIQSLTFDRYHMRFVCCCDGVLLL